MYRINNVDTAKFYSLADGWVTKFEDSTPLTSQEARLLQTILAGHVKGNLVISLDS